MSPACENTEPLVESLEKSNENISNHSKEGKYVLKKNKNSKSI